MGGPRFCGENEEQGTVHSRHQGLKHATNTNKRVTRGGNVVPDAPNSNEAQAAYQRARRQAMTSEQQVAYRAVEAERSAKARAAGKVKSLTGLQKPCPNPACEFIASASAFARSMRLHVTLNSECREWIEENGNVVQRRYLPKEEEEEEAGAPG